MDQYGFGGGFKVVLLDSVSTWFIKKDLHDITYYFAGHLDPDSLIYLGINKTKDNQWQLE